MPTMYVRVQPPHDAIAVFNFCKENVDHFCSCLTHRMSVQTHVYVCGFAARHGELLIQFELKLLQIEMVFVQ